MAKSARMLQWLVVALFLLLGTGGYFWYRSEAGVKTSATPVPSEMSASGLVGYWTFDGADYSSATVITDKSGNSHSGTLTNTPTKTTGKWGQALDFPGTNQYVSVGTVYNGVKTVAFWVWADNTTKNIIDLNATATIDVSSGTIRGNNFTSPTIYIDGIASSTPTIDTTGWHFVAITTGTGINASAVDIGRISAGYFDGRLDDVRMYSSALSASAVYQLYTAGNAKVNAPPEDPLSQSLRGYWKLDDGSGTNATDASGNGNTLAMTGSPSWVAGQIGPYSLDFSGSGQYLSVADPASGVLDFADGASFSITGWFNRDTFTADHTIVAKRNGQTATDDGYIVYIDDATDTLVFEASDTADTDEYQRVSTSAFTATGWHQFAVTWNDSATTDPVNIFIDGALNNGTATGTFANMGDLTESVAFRIGAESDAGNPFDGKLDDIRIYGYDLSADQVKKLYNTTAPTQPIDTSLVGHWTFDGTDIKGTTAIDRSSFGNNGTITGTTKTIGKLGQALSFNGSSDSVELVSVTNIPANNAQQAISLWFYQSVIADYSTIVQLINPASSSQLNIGFSGVNGYLHVAKWADTSLVDGNVPSLGVWHHLVYVYEGGNSHKLYLDGTLDASGSVAPNTASPTNVLIGNNYYSGPFDGKIDDVRIYNRMLSVTDVVSLYNAGK